MNCVYYNQTMQEGTLQEVVEAAVGESNCLKRRVVCVLLDADNRLLSVGTNHCTPPSTGCPRIGITQSFSNYTGDECFTDHAEMVALARVPVGGTPVRALIVGHDFACPSCMDIFEVLNISREVRSEKFGAGLIQ
jgi:deoxycytidylate deaminase